MKRGAKVATLVLLGATAACGIDETLLRDVDVAQTDVPDAADVTPVPMFDGASAGGAFGVFAGQASTCALANGAAFCWGPNPDGELGTNDTTAHPSPTPIAVNVSFASLTFGQNHACGREESTGKVYCWGLNAQGQLGMNDTSTRLTPQLVQGLGPAAQVSCGYRHTCAVLRDGSLYCWGDNSEGQLGQPFEAGSGNALVPIRVGTDNDWAEVSGGDGHTCGLRAPGMLYCWGRNTDEELGLGVAETRQQVRPATRAGTLDDWVHIDCGQDDSCGIRRDGSLYCWGDDSNYQLTTPTSADLKLYDPTRIGTDSDWVQVSTDVFTTCALKRDGSLYCWGRNVEGQLGTGDTNDRPDTPTKTGLDASWAMVSAGRFHVCAETTTRTVRCTGKGEEGELGLGDLMRHNVFTEVPLPTQPQR